MDVHEGDESESSDVLQVIWTCPICGESNVKFIERGRDGSPAVNDLLGHLKMIDDEQHGPYRELPDIGDVGPLEAYVETAESGNE